MLTTSTSSDPIEVGEELQLTCEEKAMGTEPNKRSRMKAVSFAECNEPTLPVEEFEACMIELLEKRMSDTSKIHPLKQALFRCASPQQLLQRYQSPSVALDEVLKQLVLALMQRRERKEAHHQRHDILQSALGGRYNECMDVLHEIERARLRRASAGCNSAACRNGACERPIRDLPLEIPAPVAKFFFRNRLSAVVYSTPVARLPLQDWEDLIMEARSDLEAYNLWANSSMPSIEPPTKRARRVSLTCLRSF